jgi:signal transduction histidine kinase
MASDRAQAIMILADSFMNGHVQELADLSLKNRLPEINQPITAVRAFARSTQQILRGTTPDLPRADRNLTTLVSQIDVAGNIVRRIREFLQRGPIMGDVDVRGMLDDVLVLIGPEAASAQISIDLAVEDNLPRFRGDRDQLEQLILNLVRNSIDAIAGGEMRGGRIRVAARATFQRNIGSRYHRLGQRPWRTALARPGQGAASSRTARWAATSVAITRSQSRVSNKPNPGNSAPP